MTKFATSTAPWRRVALTLKPIISGGHWAWAVAGNGVLAQGAVTASDRQDAVLCVLSTLRAELPEWTRLMVVVALPETARLWSLVDDIAALFPGLTVTPYCAADAGMRAEAMHALDARATSRAREQVAERPQPQLTVATDGSARRGQIGWGWLAADGQHGMDAATPRPTECTACGLAVLAELRAISAAVRALPGRDLVVRSDSRVAISLVRDWMKGLDRLPRGYIAGSHVAAAKGGLVRMQQQVRREAARLDIQWVRGHAGDPLNEGADSLAKLARRHAEGTWGLTSAELPGRAEAIAAAFATSRREPATAA